MAGGITVALSDSNVVVGAGGCGDHCLVRARVRQQLRRAPTVESPHIEGVWSYPQPVPSGIAASRQVGGKWYDLFVLHQVAFPLTAGRVAVSPARLQYSVPLAFQFFSQEERYKLETEPSSFRVRALPDNGRQPDFAGAVGHALSLQQTVTPGSGKQGEAFNAEVVVRGQGNGLAPPDLRWRGRRIYPEAAEEQVGMKDGYLAGARSFASCCWPIRPARSPCPRSATLLRSRLEASTRVPAPAASPSWWRPEEKVVAPARNRRRFGSTVVARWRGV
jgi:hypothetical protein